MGDLKQMASFTFRHLGTACELTQMELLLPLT